MASKVFKYGTRILLTDPHGRRNVVSTSEIIFGAIVQDPIHLKKTTKLHKCLGVERLSEFEVNGKIFFESLSNREKGRIGKTIGGTAKYQKEFITASRTIAKDLHIQNVHDFLSLIEIIGAEVKGLKDKELASKLLFLETEGKDEFVQKIIDDFEKVSNVFKDSEMKFDNVWSAYYHFCKHRSSFEAKFKPMPLEDYFLTLPQLIFQDINLKEIITITSRQFKAKPIIKKIYITSNDYFGVTIGTSEKELVSSMYVNDAYKNKFHERLQYRFSPSNFVLPSSFTATIIESP